MRAMYPYLPVAAAYLVGAAHMMFPATPLDSLAAGVALYLIALANKKLNVP